MPAKPQIYKYLMTYAPNCENATCRSPKPHCLCPQENQTNGGLMIRREKDVTWSARMKSTLWCT